MFLCSFFLFHLRPQFVPDDLKDDKYWARRRKNNMAAKRSRDARRMKENQIALRAGFLEKEVNFLTAGNLKPLRRLYLPMQLYNSLFKDITEDICVFEDIQNDPDRDN